MDASNVKKVFETDSDDTVNRMLANGWVLLSSVGGCNEETKEGYILYSLGWARDGDPVGLFG